MTFDAVFADDIANLRQATRRDPLAIERVMHALPAVDSPRKRRVGWSASNSEEEARGYLQARLVVLARLMFWSFALLLGFIVVLYAAFPEVEPRNNGLIETLGGIALITLALVWRGLLVRRALSYDSLSRIDAFFAIGTGVVFAVSGVLAYDLRSSAYISLIYACLTVLLRAVLIPSSPRRTFVIGTLTFLPVTVGMIVLVYLADQDVPAPGYVGGGAVVCIMSLLLATTSSRVLYGLRRQVMAAMQLGQYTLECKIGEGGSGAVYRAHHALLRRPTAIKLIRPERVGPRTLDMLEHEVQHASRLTHPNTVAIYDYGRSLDGVFYFAMEYLDGLDLQQLVTRFGGQPVDRVVPILIQICGSLAEAHDRGLIHRDVKPANVVLCERGGIPDFVKVIDFGLVREIGPGDGIASQTIVGTPAYLAPEAITDPKSIGPKSDIYALGCVAYFLITGKAVFDGKSTVSVCVQHVSAMPRQLSSVAGVELSSEVEELIMRLLSKDPSQRPTASELAKELQAIATGDTWRDEDAARWWSEFRARRSQELIHHQTITMEINLDGKNGC